jgi:hypothetical protein
MVKEEQKEATVPVRPSDSFHENKRQNIFRERESAGSRHLLARVVNILIPPINVQISMKESAARIFK